MHKLLICDLDGTLVDSRADLTTGVNLLREHYDLSRLSVETVTSYVGNGAKKLLERALTELEFDMDEALSLFKEFYRQNMLNETDLYSGVREGLEELRDAGWKLSVVTNKPTAHCVEILEYLKLREFFNPIIGGDGELPLKPDPASIHFAVSETSADYAETWIIGDNYTDLAAGRNAEIKRCFATYGFGHLQGEAYDLKVDSFQEFAIKNI